MTIAAAKAAKRASTADHRSAGRNPKEVRKAASKSGFCMWGTNHTTAANANGSVALAARLRRHGLLINNAGIRNRRVRKPKADRLRNHLGSTQLLRPFELTLLRFRSSSTATDPAMFCHSCRRSPCGPSRSEYSASRVGAEGFKRSVVACGDVQRRRRIPRSSSRA